MTAPMRRLLATMPAHSGQMRSLARDAPTDAMRISRAVEAPIARAKMVSVIPVLYAKKPPPVNSWARVF